MKIDKQEKGGNVITDYCSTNTPKFQILFIG